MTLWQDRNVYIIIIVYYYYRRTRWYFMGCQR